MDKQKALEITRDRIESINRSKCDYNESERKIADETLEYLEFIEKLLDEEGIVKNE